MASANPFAVLMSPSASATPSTHSPLGKWKRTLCYVGCLILLLSLSSQSYHFLLFFVPLLWFQFTFNLISWRNLPPSSKKTRYDVFINHRGPDTKQTLAASIYRALKLMGVSVFLDEPELDLGDSIPSEIQHAIATSFLHIAILSPTYAESTWCLEELSLMLKSGHTIIPLFYNVDVKDIRWIKGSYATAFSKHEAKKRYRPGKVEDWKSALHKVSHLKGHIFNSRG
ncbi:TMV resistance protein N-like [Cryptomeria japonica]|uniref:TMV resistance protein N-like n=1 Tax=Cryptomeria japonica TaxID=3369 RepID=UPI0027DA818D|nr:TMV resistance protein N-like [Cryptomeria japonica]